MGELSVRPGRESPWWLQEAVPDPAAAPFLGRADADVAIVGGGYTGLWTALALRERHPGLQITLLEAAFCGAGPSGRNGGFLHGYWSSLARLRDRIGDAGALEVCRAGDRVLPAVRAFCEARGEDVWLRESGLLKVSASAAQDAAVDGAVAAAEELAVADEAVPLARDELAERCRSPVFRRGVLFRDGATVQPARLVRALRRAALADGVTVHERTPVLRIRAGDPVELETVGGVLRAAHAVVAVNAAASGWRPVARRLTNFGSYVVLTEPVPELLEEIGWTGGEAIMDGRMFLHYFRTTPDGRVVMGSGSGPIGLGGPPRRSLRDRRRDGRPCRGRSPQAPARRCAGTRDARVGRADRRLMPTSFRSSAPRPADDCTTASATRGTASARAGSEARSWRRSSSAPRTSGARLPLATAVGAAASPGAAETCRRGAASGVRSSPRRRPRRKGAARDSRPVLWPLYLVPSVSASGHR